MNNITATIDRIKKSRGSILAGRKKQGVEPATCADIRRIVVINSSSRSGSSLLYTLLAKLPGIISLTGEAAPFYKLNTRLDRFNPHESEKIPTELLAEAIDFNGLARDFLADIYLPEKICRTADIDADGYIEDLALRFLLQWTDIDAAEDELREIITGGFCQLRGSQPGFQH